MNILLSIIVPVYNVEPYLPKCIESILNQRFSDFELILVDDGSLDGSGKICDDYAKQDERIKVIHKENGGLSSARNVGLDVAQGEYIGFVDSDDWIEVEMYEVMYNLAQLYNADVVQCKFTTKEEINKLQEEIKILTPLEALNYGYDHPKLKSSMIVAWNKIYRNRLFRPIRYPIGKINEDEFTTYKLFYQANKIVLLNREFYYYRQRNTSIMGQPFNVRRYDGVEAICEKIEFAKRIDQKLYLKVQKEYTNILLEMFMNTEIAISNNSKYLKRIRTRYNSVFRETMSNPYVSNREKLKYIMFRWMPSICTKILRRKRKQNKGRDVESY